MCAENIVPLKTHLQKNTQNTTEQIEKKKKKKKTSDTFPEKLVAMVTREAELVPAALMMHDVSSQNKRQTIPGLFLISSSHKL